MTRSPRLYFRLLCILAGIDDVCSMEVASGPYWSSTCSTGSDDVACTSPASGDDRSTMLQQGIGVHWTPPTENSESRDDDMTRARLLEKVQLLEDNLVASPSDKESGRNPAPKTLDGDDKDASQIGALNTVRVFASAIDASMDALEGQVDGIVSFAGEVSRRLPPHLTGTTSQDQELSALKAEVKATLQGLGNHLNSIKSSFTALSPAVPSGAMAAMLADHVGKLRSMLQSAVSDLDACLQVLTAALSFADPIYGDDATQQFEELDKNLLRGVRKVHAFKAKFEHAWDGFIHGVMNTFHVKLPEIDEARRVSSILILLKKKGHSMISKLSNAADQVAGEVVAATMEQYGSIWRVQQVAGLIVLTFALVLLTGVACWWLAWFVSNGGAQPGMLTAGLHHANSTVLAGPQTGKAECIDQQPK